MGIQHTEAIARPQAPLWHAVPVPRTRAQPAMQASPDTPASKTKSRETR